ncbi:hypothetical protein EIN_485100 [Entamoeba invadens IP1]|uniref:PRA1 family protein n=1 Tax=Entamoeba invadens IP1 TaxID=370355 RepID=A0A0A1UAD4_ENTIV|nr:hypothetical protein EIN_485100 [Entamoeba invadens IP1]ELP89148.1 hypothetical protein EIN_485100 [Entamoeba invadens IP1]|eukprot:XP_004255919.1 hypothetical protein EIN_485100 [Entamoeba invadens IP1]
MEWFAEFQNEFKQFSKSVYVIPSTIDTAFEKAQRNFSRYEKIYECLSIIFLMSVGVYYGGVALVLLSLLPTILIGLVEFNAPLRNAYGTNPKWCLAYGAVLPTVVVSLLYGAENVFQMASVANASTVVICVHAALSSNYN